jgi:hypothetical protein
MMCRQIIGQSLKSHSRRYSDGSAKAWNPAKTISSWSERVPAMDPAKAAAIQPEVAAQGNGRGLGRYFFLPLDAW